MNKKYTLGVLLFGCMLSYVFASANMNMSGRQNKSAITNQKLAFGKQSMVVTNNRWSSQAAKDILAKGGTATDAAIAAAFVLGLTEPQSSGIGGGGYAISYYNKKLITYDGREVAPHSATPKWFLDANGKPFDFRTAWLSSRSVGVPGEVAMLYEMHKHSGKLKWAQLIQPAIELAKNGFPMSKLLHQDLTQEQTALIDNPQLVTIYFNADKTVKAVADIIKNPDYAATLAQIAANPNSFYFGKIAKDIIKTVNNNARQKLYNSKDLRSYHVITNDAVCSDYRSYQICSVPPSSAGGVTLQEIIKLFANKYKFTGINDSKWVYIFLQASKLAYADRNEYLADPQFVKQPITGLLDEDYLDKRSNLITESALAIPVMAGVPEGIDRQYTADNSPKPHGTTSIAVVDKDGNAVSMTVTVESLFGSHLFVDGFFLNNELTDFSFLPADADNNKPIANRVEAGKRPRSSVSPTIVFDKNNQLYAVAGSPGGSYIICTVARNLILMLDFHLNPYEAAAYPNFCAMNNTPVIESGISIVSPMVPQLEARGDKVRREKVFSGETNIIRGTKNGWIGGADPRREGMALGD